MDSPPRPTRPAPPPAAAERAAPDAAPPPGALARLGRLLPGVGALVRFAYGTAGASAVSAVLIWFALFEGPLRAGALGGAAGSPASGASGVAFVAAALLLVPAAAAALAGWTLADLAALPGQLRDAALAATGRGERRPGRGGGRRLGLVRALWAARGLALTSKGAWLRAVGAVRFVRLASLPFALALAGLFALNALVILGGAVALVVLLV